MSTEVPQAICDPVWAPLIHAGVVVLGGLSAVLSAVAVRMLRNGDSVPRRRRPRANVADDLDADVS